MILIILSKYSIYDIIGQIKAQSARKFEEKIPQLVKVFCRENIVWLAGYFVSTVGIDEKNIIKNVQLQES